MTKSIKVSVVVPMYNVETYIRECVDSILNQTLEDIEVILVDDGSPDHCGEIAEEYARKDSRVKVIHQENAGLGPARNTGISRAIGEYIGFVDSDDWVRPEMFEKLYAVAKENNSDIVIGGHREYLDGIEHDYYPHPLGGQTYGTINDIRRLRVLLYGRDLNDFNPEPFPMRVWTSIYRSSMLLDGSVWFENVMSEDTIFNLDAYKEAKKISFTKDADYCYRMGDHYSITRSFSKNTLTKYTYFLNRLYSKALLEKSEDCVQRVKRTAIAYSRMYIYTLLNSNLKWREKKFFFSEFVKSDFFTCYCLSYPLVSLPPMQRAFQNQLNKRRFFFTVLLMKMRSFLKKHKVM